MHQRWWRSGILHLDQCMWVVRCFGCCCTIAKRRYVRRRANMDPHFLGILTSIIKNKKKFCPKVDTILNKYFAKFRGKGGDPGPSTSSGGRRRGQRRPLRREWLGGPPDARWQRREQGVRALAHPRPCTPSAAALPSCQQHSTARFGSIGSIGSMRAHGIPSLKYHHLFMNKREYYGYYRSHRIMSLSS